MSKNWLSKIYNYEKKIYSQGYQDGIIEYILQNIEIKNKYCIEFGYNSNNLNEGSGPNTTNLLLNHNWEGLLLDGNNNNEKINLHKHFLTEDNICDIFEKYNVPLEPGYISIDVDSTDLWLTNSILQKYKPLFYSVEFNPNFPIEYAITFPKNNDKGWTGDKIFGASLKALNIVAINNQYTLVYAGCLKTSFHHDAFFVRNDLIKNCQGRPILEDFRFIYCPIHSPCNTDRYKIMIDYEEFLLTNDIIKSQKKAENICKKYLC
jgi:hypothetical protein